MKKRTIKDLFNIPNFLCYFRIILIPIFLHRYFLASCKEDYYLCAFILILSGLSDFLDGYIARKYNLVTNTGKVLDAIADKILVNSILIILCGQGYITPVIPVILVLRDTVVNTIKMIAGNSGDVVAAIKTGKFKTAFLMIGLSLKLFGNFPMGLYNIALDDFFLITATVLSVVSGIEYYNIYKKYIKD